MLENWKLNTSQSSPNILDIKITRQVISYYTRIINPLKKPLHPVNMPGVGTEQGNVYGIMIKHILLDIVKNYPKWVGKINFYTFFAQEEVPFPPHEIQRVVQGTKKITGIEINFHWQAKV